MKKKIVSVSTSYDVVDRENDDGRRRRRRRRHSIILDDKFDENCQLCDILTNLMEKHKSNDRATLCSFWYLVIVKHLSIRFEESAELSECITTLDNETANDDDDGVFVFLPSSSLAQDCLKLAEFIARRDIKFSDFGITCVFMTFSHYVSRYQYPVMSYNLKFIDEFEIVERLLLDYLKTLKVTANIATDAEFGLLKNRDSLFVGHKFIKIRELRSILEIMKNNTDTELFLDLIKDYHISIIETFYIFTSCFGRSKFSILECRELSKNAFNFVFPKHITVDIFHGDFWFPVPKNSTWFAYKNSKCVYKTFTGRNTDILLQREFTRLPLFHELIYGFITPSNYIYPIVFYDPKLDTWTKIIAFLIEQKLNCAFMANSDPLFNSVAMTSIHFVSEKHNKEIFKLVKKK